MISIDQIFDLLGNNESQTGSRVTVVEGTAAKVSLY